MLKRSSALVLALLLLTAPAALAAPAAPVWLHQLLDWWSLSPVRGLLAKLGPEVDPNGQPTANNGPYVDPDGQPAEKNGPEIDPDGQPAEKNGPHVDPDGQPTANHGP